MKKKNYPYIAALVFLFLTFSSCQTEKRYAERLADEIEDGFSASELEKYRFIVLIPQSGCAGCISEAENFYLSHRERTDILFLFTKFIIERDLRLKLNIRDSELSNVCLDKEGRYYLSKYEECKYPVAISLRNGKVLRVNNLDVLLDEKADSDD